MEKVESIMITLLERCDGKKAIIFCGKMKVKEGG